MSETRTEKEFTPISTQAEFDERIKARLAREREKWEKDTGTEDLKAQLEAKDEEIATIRREHYLEDARRAVIAELDRRGVDEGRRERVMKLVDLEAIEAGDGGRPRPDHVLAQVDSVASDLPELVRPRGAGSGGSGRPVLKQEPPLRREDVEKMSEEDVNSNWDGVRAFLAGERS